MTSIVHASDLTDREKRLLFWASFLSLAATGFGFAFRDVLLYFRSRGGYKPVVLDTHEA